jgi:hypothetical protein
MTKVYSAAYHERHRPALQHIGANRQHWRPYRISPEPTPEKLDEVVQKLAEHAIEAVSCGIQGGHAVIAVEPNRHNAEELHALVHMVAQATERAH